MKTLLTVVMWIFLLYASFEVIRFVYLLHASRSLVKHAEAYENSSGKRTILVVGDSTAVGVGAHDPKLSVPGRLGEEMKAIVENHARSGAVTADITAQIAQAKERSYDLVLIQVGANDVLKFRDLDAAGSSLKAALAAARSKSDRIVLLTAGRIGEAPIFPWFIRSMITARAAALRERFKATAEMERAVYVDLFAIDDPFAEEPRRYYAIDRLHLADDGYGFWYSAVREAILAEWPFAYE